MTTYHTLVYWKNKNLYVGKIRGLSGLYSEAETIEELEKKLQTAYRQLIAINPEPQSLSSVKTKSITLLAD